MTTKRIKYEPGAVFACQLPRGGWGAFVVPRWTELPSLSRKQAMICGVNRVWASCPSAEDAGALRYTDVCYFEFANCGALSRGLFPCIGRVETFDSNDWPAPIQRTWGRPDGGPIEITVVEVWAGGFIEQQNYLKDLSELDLLPYRSGLSYVEGFAESLDKALRDRHPAVYFAVSQAAINLWNRIYADLERNGKLKEFAADGWYSGGIDRTRPHKK